MLVQFSIFESYFFMVMIMGTILKLDIITITRSRDDEIHNSQLVGISLPSEYTQECPHRERMD